MTTRLHTYCLFRLLTILLMVAGVWFPNRASADDGAKPETPPAAVKETLDNYLKALAANDLKAMTALADVPWLDCNRQVVRNPSDLSKALERVAAQMPRSKEQRKVEAYRYKTMRERVEDKTDRRLLDSLMGENGWLVFMEEEGYLFTTRVILIREKGGKAAVIAGPLKMNQLISENRIPEVVERLLDTAETFELYSLNPEWKTDKEGKIVEEKGSFHGWEVLGKTEVKGEAERKRLATSLRLGAEDNFGTVGACFNPRHGLRLKAGSQTVDLVICFQCLQVQVFREGEKQKGFLVTEEPQKGFDAILKGAGVKLPKPAK